MRTAFSLVRLSHPAAVNMFQLGAVYDTVQATAHRRELQISTGCSMQAVPGGVPAMQYFSSAQQVAGPVQPAVTPKVPAPVSENVTSYEISPYR